MRKLKRSIARAKMGTEGIKHINKKSINPRTGLRTGRSFFSENWRKYCY